MESAGLSDFARHALKEMCKQDWVQEKFLKDPEAVLSSDLLLDNMLSNKQVSWQTAQMCQVIGELQWGTHLSFSVKSLNSVLEMGKWFSLCILVDKIILLYSYKRDKKLDASDCVEI